MKRHSNARYFPTDEEIRTMWEMYCQGLCDRAISRRTGYPVNVVFACLSQIAPDGRIMADAYGGMSPDERPKDQQIVNPLGESPDAILRQSVDRPVMMD